MTKTTISLSQKNSRKQYPVSLLFFLFIVSFLMMTTSGCSCNKAVPEKTLEKMHANDFMKNPPKTKQHQEENDKQPVSQKNQKEKIKEKENSENESTMDKNESEISESGSNGSSEGNSNGLNGSNGASTSNIPTPEVFGGAPAGNEESDLKAGIELLGEARSNMKKKNYTQACISAANARNKLAAHRQNKECSEQVKECDLILGKCAEFLAPDSNITDNFDKKNVTD